MRLLSRFVVLFMSVVCLVACAVKGPASGPARVLTGEVVYRERMALPPSAVAVITLLEIRPGQAPVDVSTLRVAFEGRSIPLPFTLALDGKNGKVGKLPPSASYALTASIEAHGVVMFRTPNPVSVDLDAPSTPLVLLTHRESMSPEGPGCVEALDRLASAAPHVFAVATPAAEKATLVLDKDQAYTLRRQTPDGLREESGRWHQLRDGSVQLATPGREARLLTVEGKSLVLREDGQRTGKKSNQPVVVRFTLQTGQPEQAQPEQAQPEQAQPEQAQPGQASTAPRKMTGLYRQQGENGAGGTFRDCATHTVYATRDGSGRQLLQEVYLSKARVAGEELLATVDGITRASAEPDTLPSLRVERFLTMDAGQCQPLDSTPPAMLLGGARWKLLEAFGVPVRTVDNSEEAHLVFEPSGPDRGAVFGSDGCNRFRGSYLLQGEQLSFSQMASTLMLCQELGSQPQTFHRALAEANGWRAMGRVLELTRNGRLIAVFEKTAL